MRSSLALLPLLAVLGGCVPPSDSRPGLWLSGSASELPDDWSFTDSYREIALEVSAPHLLAHSVTIWCASLDGQLYVAARSPEDKRWPGWVARDPNVRLKIGEQIYEAELSVLDDPTEIAKVRSAYTAKYDLPDPPPEGAPPLRYWRVEPRG